MSIFTKRLEFKPFEYPNIIEYKNAINHSYWLVSEWNFVSDIQDFNTRLSKEEQNIIKNTLLSISQIEVAVKKFWARLGDRFPKPEFDQVGITFGESEIRHADAYSHLLQVLNLNDDFKELMKNECILGRVNYLSKYLKDSDQKSNEEYTFTLTLFSIFVENISLFSQFVIIKSFNKYKNCLKDIDNVVQATQKEEIIHAMFGFYLINQIKKEQPQWFGEDFYSKLETATLKAFEAESLIIDWIFELGEPSFLTKVTLKEFIKDRFNESLLSIGAKPVFLVDQTEITKLKWFNEEILAEVNSDFFYKKPVTYSKKTKSITSGDLFND